jgi:hypothetical protein
MPEPEMPEFPAWVLRGLPPDERLTVRLTGAQIAKMEAAAGYMARPSMGGLLKLLLDHTTLYRLRQIAEAGPKVKVKGKGGRPRRVFHGQEKRETPAPLDVDVVMRELRVSRARAQLMLDRGRVEVAGGTVRRAT